VIKFNSDIVDYGTWVKDLISPKNTLQAGVQCGARVAFGADTVMVKVGTSFISLDQARENLAKEIPQWDFNEVENESYVAWNKYLNRIEIETDNKNEKPILYTGLYHSLLFPRQFSEYGRYYSAFDDQVHTGTSYNDYSLWDTYRAEHPLLIFLTPELVPGMIQSLIQMYEEGGYMPKWPNPSYTGIMIGTHADAVVADAVVKGIKGFDLQKAWLACRKDAMVPPDGDSIKWWGDRDPWTSYEARAGLSWYMKLGYVPVDKTAESVSNTLEGAYDDFCVAQVAKAVGKTDEYDYLMKRSQNYHNLYNKETGFMAPRLSTGQWGPNPSAGFTEGSPWTYLFCGTQDIPGLITLLGGPKEFVKKLDKTFTGRHYVHENEPGHHYTYLYDYAGAAWKTQMRVAHYRHAKYRNSPQGLNGDDDCGQMSAWYTFSALGFYPVTPGTNVYAIGTPLYKKATMYFDPNDRSKKFVITANNISKKNIYVQSVTVNGKKLDKPFLYHSDIINGGQMEFEMGPKPLK
jgi:predicted alpha-1,2-mannosidase